MMIISDTEKSCWIIIALSRIAHLACALGILCAVALLWFTCVWRCSCQITPTWGAEWEAKGAKGTLVTPATSEAQAALTLPCVHVTLARL